MDLLTQLLVFFIIATIIKIASNNTAKVVDLIISFVNEVFIRKVVPPKFHANKYRLLFACCWTFLAIFGLNYGMLRALDIPFEFSARWFDIFDLIISSVFLTGGAQAIHKLDDAVRDYLSKKKEE